MKGSPHLVGTQASSAWVEKGFLEKAGFTVITSGTPSAASVSG